MSPSWPSVEAYLPHARSGDGICWLPDGEAVYGYADPRLHHARRAARGAPRLRPRAHRRDRRGARRRSPGELGFADVAALRAHLDADPANHATEPADLVRIGAGAGGAGRVGRARLVRTTAARRLRGAPGRAAPGAGGAAGLLLPAGTGRLPARHLLHQHLPARARGPSTAWPRRRSTRPYPATTSRSPSRPSWNGCQPSGASVRGWPGQPTPRAGASTASGSRTRWASMRTPASASACSTRRPGGRPAWSSTPACTRSAGSVSGASTSCARPRA